jgi:hypothetical protein
LATAAKLINPQIKQRKKVRRLLCQTNKAHSRLNDPPLGRSALQTDARQDKRSWSCHAVVLRLVLEAAACQARQGSLPQIKRNFA